MQTFLAIVGGVIGMYGFYLTETIRIFKKDNRYSSGKRQVGTRIGRKILGIVLFIIGLLIIGSAE